MEIYIASRRAGKKSRMIEDALKKIMYFETEELFSKCVASLSNGKSIILDALTYIGNGRHVNRSLRKRYRYKMIVPIVDNNGRLYSTDLFEGARSNAEKGEYGMYHATRQLAIDLVNVIDTDYSINRFGFGYKDGSYGYYKIKK